MSVHLTKVREHWMSRITDGLFGEATVIHMDDALTAGIFAQRTREFLQSSVGIGLKATCDGLKRRLQAIIDYGGGFGWRAFHRRR